MACPYRPMVSRFAWHFLVWQQFVPECDRDTHNFAPSVRPTACSNYSALVILLGITRGTILGPIHDLSSLFGTNYGITFLVAALMTIALALWGTFVSGRAAKQLNEIPLTEAMLVKGTPSPAFAIQLQRVKLFVLLELLGFFLIFTTMILMSFGI